MKPAEPTRVGRDDAVGTEAAVDDGASGEQPFSRELEAWLCSDAPKTLGSLGAVFAERGFAVAVLLLMLVPAIPAPTGGVTHVFEAITVLLGLEMVLGRSTIWLPERWRRRELGALTTGKALPFVVRRVRWFERHSRRRLGSLFERRWFLRGVGLLVVVFSVGAAVAPPFSGLDTLPALGVVLVALGVLLGDVVFLLAGSVVGVAGWALIVTIGREIAHLVRSAF